MQWANSEFNLKSIIFKKLIPTEMKSSKTLLHEITELTNRIESYHPELYRFLDENPMTVPDSSHPKIDASVLQDYLESLEKMLAHHLDTHQKLHG